MNRRQFLLSMGAVALASGFPGISSSKESISADNARAAYLSIDKLYSGEHIKGIESLLGSTELNAVVIDFKVGKPETGEYMRKLIERFKSGGAFVIGRLVTFQDTYYAKYVRPDLALRLSNGDFWYSGRRKWNRYWLDMSSSEVWDYNIGVAKQGIDVGFDEINFDYIRFPSDGPKNQPPQYPKWNGKIGKEEVLAAFFDKLRRELKAHNSKITLSIDIYGYVFLRGVEPGVGQELLSISQYFDVVAPMAYPSHYQCGEFGVRDPNTVPAKVYHETLFAGLEKLKTAGRRTVVRPWIQHFSIPNIYSCGPEVEYDKAMVWAQINASKALGVRGYMLWSPASRYGRSFS